MFIKEINDTFSTEQLNILRRVIGYEIDKILYSSARIYYNDTIKQVYGSFTDIFLLYLSSYNNSVVLSFKFWAEDNPFFNRYDMLLMEELTQRHTWHIPNNVKNIPFDIKHKVIKKIRVYGTKALRNITQQYIADIWKTTEEQQRIKNFYQIPQDCDTFSIIRQDNHLLVFELDTSEKITLYTESSAYMNEFRITFFDVDNLSAEENMVENFKKIHLADNEAEFLLHYEIGENGIRKQK